MDVNLTVLLRFVLRVYTRSAGRTNDFLLQGFSTVATASSSFPSARVFWLFSSCLEWNLLFKSFHEFANSCRVRNRRTWQPSEFTFIAGSVLYFINSIIRYRHCNCSLPKTTKSSQPVCGSGGAACTVKFDAIRKSPGNDQRYGSQELMYLWYWSDSSGELSALFLTYRLQIFWSFKNVGFYSLRLSPSLLDTWLKLVQ